MKKKPKILLIEDDKQLQKLYKTKFNFKGYETFIASDGEEALALASQELPDLILLDLMLPKIGGLTVLRALKENSATKNIPVIILSALSESQVMTDGLAYGAMLYLTKEKTVPSQVLESIEKALKKKNE
ncbi:MAG: response regulator [Candidatus Aenigmarchaeota archaeon]|nr:response regulator [Candidatus Aenigmarchaeota archaeon]